MALSSARAVVRWLTQSHIKARKHDLFVSSFTAGCGEADQRRSARAFIKTEHDLCILGAGNSVAITSICSLLPVLEATAANTFRMTHKNRSSGVRCPGGADRALQQQRECPLLFEKGACSGCDVSVGVGGEKSEISREMLIDIGKWQVLWFMLSMATR